MSRVNQFNYSLMQCVWHIRAFRWTFSWWWVGGLSFGNFNHDISLDGSIIRAGEMMDSLVVGSMNDSYCLDRASALVFSEPGQYVTMKSYLVKNKDHLACLWLSLLADF